MASGHDWRSMALVGAWGLFRAALTTGFVEIREFGGAQQVPLEGQDILACAHTGRSS